MLTARLALASFLLCGAAAAQFVPDVVTSLDISSSIYQLQFTSLIGQGYRPISLSLTGGLASQRYSVVWIRRSGAAIAGVHGATPAQYATWRATQLAAGYRPLLIAGAGSSSDTAIAAIWVRDGVDAVDEYDITESTFAARNTSAYDDDRRLTCVGVHGNSLNRRYSAVWEVNPDEDGWCWDTSTSSDYAAEFAAHVDGYGRLGSAQELPDGRIGQIWHDDSLGGFVALPDLTKTQLETEITNRAPSGWYPIDIKQNGASIAARFHVVFAPRDRPIAKSLSRTGTAVIGLQPFDDYMEAHVLAHGIRASAIAITKHGRLVYARGYTYGEPGYPQTTPTSLFRIASVSKPVTALMAQLLIQRGGTISASTRVAAYTGLTSAAGQFNAIEVGHLIAHESGLDSDCTSYGVAYARNPNNPILPVTNRQTSEWMRDAVPMHAAPGVDYQYSNLGYYLLDTVVQTASGKSYERFLREDIAAPFGISRMWVGPNERAQLHPGEVAYRNRYLEITPSEIHTDRHPVSVQFGGGGDENLTRRAGAGGVVTSVVDIVRLFSGAFDIACDGGPITQATADRLFGERGPLGGANPGGFGERSIRPNGVIALGKNGELWGSSTQLIHRSDGVTIAVFDGKQGSNASRGQLNDIADAITSWPTFDLFPTYGLPAYVRHCPRIDATTPTSLPNVTDDVITIDGELLSGVDRISFGSNTITSRSSTTWVNGWFDIVSDRRIELHVPQGLMATTYDVTLRNGSYAAAPFQVRLTRTTTHVLGAPATSFVGFELLASRGSSTSSAVALLAFSLVDRPSVLPGTVSLGIGAGFSQLWTWPTAVNFNLITACARWQVPDLAAGTLHFQAIVVDPNAIGQPPYPTTNVRSVRSL